MTYKQMNRYDIDPVCGMKVEPSASSFHRHYGGRRYIFCSAACLNAFIRRPEKFIKPKGIISRWLDRLGRTNRNEFGSSGPCCH